MALMITKNDINQVYGNPYTPAPKITKSDLDTVYGTPPSYTDIQKNALSRPVKQTKTNTQKYGTVNGKTVLPYHIENQGLYDLSKKSKFDYFADGVAKGTVGSIAQAGEALKQSLTGETGKADRALYDFTMESAYNPSKANQLQYYIAQKQNADRNTYLNTDTFGYKMLNSAQKDMQKATEGMGETGKFLTNVAGTVAQNALVAPLAFVNPSLAAGVMATSAAGNSIKQQADSGKSLKEANFRGAVDGLIEYGLGKIGIDSYLDNIQGNGNVLANIGKNMLSEGGEEALSYLANYGVDKISGNSDAEFDWKEFWYNILAGATAGGVLGTGGAVIGKVGKSITMPQPEIMQLHRPNLDTNKKAKTNTGIFENMNDTEKYKVLKDRHIKVVHTDGFELDENLVEQLKTSKQGEVKKMFKALAEKLGIIKAYNTPDINFEFKFSKSNVSESVQKTKSSHHSNLAQSFHYLNEIVDNAVLIEVHEDRYKGTQREDKDLQLAYELISAYSSYDGIVPIKLTIKEFKTKNDVLYSVTAYKKIKKADIVTQTATENSGLYNAPSAFDVSLSNLFLNVNGEHSLYQYIPKQFYSDKIYKAYTQEVDRNLQQYLKQKDADDIKSSKTDNILTEKILDDNIIEVNIGKSLGASAKNYPVKMPDNNQRVRLAEGQTIVGKTFAGKGTDKEIRVRYILSSCYNIDPDEFEKVSGNGIVIINGKKQKAELHWYEANGERFEMKIKRYIE